jgi:hypothetical protein
MTIDPDASLLASVAVTVHVPAVVEEVYVLMTCPEAFVLPVPDTVPHEPAMLGVVVNVTGSSKATPDPVVTVTVMTVWLSPLAGRLVVPAATATAGGGGAKNPKASMTILTGTGLLLNKSVAAPFSGASVKF